MYNFITEESALEETIKLWQIVIALIEHEDFQFPRMAYVLKEQARNLLYAENSLEWELLAWNHDCPCCVHTRDINGDDCVKCPLFFIWEADRPEPSYEWSCLAPCEKCPKSPYRQYKDGYAKRQKRKTIKGAIAIIQGCIKRLKEIHNER